MIKLLLLFSLIATCQLVQAADGLSLRVTPTQITISSNSFLDISVIIENNSKRTVTLATPLEGSDQGWRTPIVGWSIIPILEEAGERPPEHPKDPPLNQPLPRCGNGFHPSVADVFKLKPGKKMVIPTPIAPLLNRPPGRYRAVFYYRNDPHKPLWWLRSEQKKSAAERAIKKSTPANLISNEILLTVTP